MKSNSESIKEQLPAALLSALFVREGADYPGSRLFFIKQRFMTEKLDSADQQEYDIGSPQKGGRTVEIRRSDMKFGPFFQKFINSQWKGVQGKKQTAVADQILVPAGLFPCSCDDFCFCKPFPYCHAMKHIREEHEIYQRYKHLCIGDAA